MDATAIQEPPRIVPTIAQPANLSSGDGNLYLCYETLYLAQRMADRGEPGQANVQLRNALVYAQKINPAENPGDFNAAMSWYAQVEAYVSNRELEAESLKAHAAVSDATYEKSQVLTAAQLTESVNDNADLQHALDAQARGENPDLAYNAGYVARETGKASAAVQGAVTDTLSAALGPWKWWILAALGVGLGSAFVYGYVSLRTARGV
jgi:hypothetical protein